MARIRRLSVTDDGETCKKMCSRKFGSFSFINVKLGSLEEIVSP